MIVTLVVLIPLLIITVFIYYKLSPQNADTRKVKTYNLSTIVAAIALSIVLVLRVRASMIDGSDAARWPYIALIFSSGIIVGTIFVSGNIRNLVIFRK